MNQERMKEKVCKIRTINQMSEKDDRGQQTKCIDGIWNHVWNWITARAVYWDGRDYRSVLSSTVASSHM